jgi:THO complex subunit 2
MTKFRQKYLDKVKARVNASAMNALAMAAALESGPPVPTRTRPSTTAATTAATEEQEEKPAPVKEEQDQKGMLCIALLSVGALRPALAIMSKFPWMVDAYPEIADLVIRVLKVSLEPIYQNLLGNKERNLDFLQPRPRYAPNGLQKPQPRKTVPTLVAPTPPGTHVVDYVFFYPHWAERVPVCKRKEDVENVIEPMVRMIGFHIAREPVFLTKLARVGRAQVSATVRINVPTINPLVRGLTTILSSFYFLLFTPSLRFLRVANERKRTCGCFP